MAPADMKHFPLKNPTKNDYNVGVSTKTVGSPFLLYGGNLGRADFVFLGKCVIKKGENEMRKYKSNGELETVICNCCGKKLAVKDSILREGGLEIKHAWDYFSEKDGEIHKFDLCEECYDEMLGTFRIPAEVEETREFL